MRLPGMGESLTRHFRDKLAMRVRARQCGVPVPEFTSVFNYDDIRSFLDHVPGPWLLKPRTNASAIGIRKIETPDALWPILDELGDLQSHYLLERFVPGEIFHVEGITWNGQVLFSSAYKYGKPPMQTMHQGGVFSTRTLDRESIDALALDEDSHQRVIESLGLISGVTHTEFIKAHSDGTLLLPRDRSPRRRRSHRRSRRIRLRFQPLGRVGENRSRRSLPHGVHTAQAEASLRRQHHLPRTSGAARHLQPTTLPRSSSASNRHHHAGLIVCAESAYARRNSVNEYSNRFLEDFCAVVPAPDKPTA